MSKLYHIDVYWKDEFNEDIKTFIQNKRVVSSHLISQIRHDRNGKHKISIPRLNRLISSLMGRVDDVKAFEVEYSGEKVVKCVIRARYNQEKDVSIVFGVNKIVTAWLNDRSDEHLTLKHWKYVKGRV